ncbi:MAG: PAS domain S-box protein [Dehalococcoidia bacterium]
MTKIVKTDEQNNSMMGESAELAQALMRCTGAGIYIVQDGKFQYVNSLFQELTGYTQQELLGIYPLDLVHPEDRETVRKKAIENLKGHRLLPYEYRFIKKNGEVMRVLERLASIEYGGKRAAVGSFVDVTERKQAEESLRRSEQNFHDIIEKSPFGIHVLDKRGKSLYINRALLDIWGYSSIEELEAVPRKQRYTPESYVQHMERVEKTKRGEPTPLSYELSIVCSDGQVRHLSVSRGELLWNGEKRFQMVYRDITERKRAEAELELRSQLLDSATDSIFVHDFEGNFIYVNETACRAHGYSREEFMKLKLQDIVAQERVRRLESDFQEMLEEGQVIFESAHRRKDGSVMPVEIHGRTIEADGRKLLLTVIRDITGRKRAEEALKESEERYRFLVELSPEAIFVASEGKHVFVNSAGLKLLGASSPDQIIGKPVADFIHPDYREIVTERMRKAMEAGIAPPVMEEKFVRFDGTAIDVEVRAASLVYQGKMAMQAVVSDITERKRAEEERGQFERKAQIAGRLASVGKMAAGIAHEINNPLTSVIGYSQLLSGREDIPEDVKMDLKGIDEGAQRVAGIIRRLLTFARQSRPERTLVSINDLITNTLDLRAYHLRINNIKVTAKLATDLPLTTADPAQLQQVFLNIIVNAEAEMKQARGRDKLLIKTEEVNGTIRISFKDNGPGIAKKNLARIFDPFFTTREVDQGTGLGLSICHGIIAEHKGRIWAESRLGRGATFIVELPIATEDRQPVLLEPAVEEPKKVTKARPRY